AFIIIKMNLLTPPFDDINVRKAVNLVINKAALQKAWGGPIAGRIATHILPPSVLAFPSTYDPYPSTGFRGDLEAAKSEMRQSKYDADGDGLCDLAACEDVLFLNRSIPPFTTLTPTIESNLASIGIKTRLRELDTSSAYSTLQTVKNLIPISAIAGWAKDFADPSTFGVQFISEGINCEGQVNYSEIGMTREKALECGVGPEWQAAGGTALPSVDDRFAQCTRLTGRDRTT